jgi:hypothetical protein
MSTQSESGPPTPASVLITFFCIGAGAGCVAHYITLSIFDSLIRPRFFPNLPAYYRNRPEPENDEPENDEFEDEDEDPVDAGGINLTSISTTKGTVSSKTIPSTIRSSSMLRT